VKFAVARSRVWLQRTHCPQRPARTTTPFLGGLFIACPPSATSGYQGSRAKFATPEAKERPAAIGGRVRFLDAGERSESALGIRLIPAERAHAPALAFKPD